MIRVIVIHSLALMVCASLAAQETDEERDARFRRLILDASRNIAAPWDAPAFRDLATYTAKAEAPQRRALLREILKADAHAADKDNPFAIIALAGALAFRPDDKVIVCCSHLYDDDGKLRRLCLEVLEFNILHTKPVRRSIDFTPISEHLGQGDGLEIRDNAYRYMFQRLPSSAFEEANWLDQSTIKDRKQLFIWKDEAELAITKCRVIAGKKDPNEPGVVADAEKALGVLAKRDQWWCQLYVAETVARNPGIFKNPDAFPELQKSEHPWVREALDNPFSEEIIHYRRRKSGNDIYP